MQVPVLGCTFLTLSDRPLMISALMIGAQQCHPQVLRTCAQQCTHLCHSAVSHTCAQKCHLPVPRSATYLWP
ncbi:unnamed protein product, partial [Staurois parvus]